MLATNLWRIVLCIICVVSFVILLNRFRINRQSWNVKTRDYWYALTAWTFVGIVGNLEALLRDLPFRYSIVFTSAASIVTLTGILRQGSWGGTDRDRK